MWPRTLEPKVTKPGLTGKEVVEEVAAEGKSAASLCL